MSTPYYTDDRVTLHHGAHRRGGRLMTTTVDATVRPGRWARVAVPRPRAHLDDRPAIDRQEEYQWTPPTR